MVSNPTEFEERQYSLKALHTTQFYRLSDGILYYRTAKSDVEYRIPLHTVKSQRWRRYFDQYFFTGLMVLLVGLIYFMTLLERGALRWNVKHFPFVVGVLLGAIQAVYWARFPRTYRLITTSGDSVGIIVDNKDPQRSLEFIEAVKKEIGTAQKMTAIPSS